MTAVAVTSLFLIICASTGYADPFPRGHFGLRFGFSPVKGYDVEEVYSPHEVFGFSPLKNILEKSTHDLFENAEGLFTTLTSSKLDVFKKLTGVDQFGRCAVRGPSLCDVNQRYRSINGTCNNLVRPTLGAAGNTYTRLLPPWYSEYNQPPVSVTGYKLPPPRDISLVMFPDKQLDDPEYTLLAMQWGQLMSHDMSNRIEIRLRNCCTTARTSSLPPSDSDATCYNILLRPTDPDFGPYGVGCLQIYRTTRDACSHHGADQLTSVTAFLDASMVYGSEQQLAEQLRLFKGGLLRTELSQLGRRFPPPHPEGNRSFDCFGSSSREACFLAGDDRANQHPQLTILQVILLREHNRIASALVHLNPHWDDEKIYQEARRILIAEYQHITYWEWLPLFIGYEVAKRLKVLPTLDGYGADYDDTVDPGVLNEHATAAFRFFHTAVQGKIKLVTEDREKYGSIQLGDFFGQPDIIQRDGKFDDLLRGLTTQPEHRLDQFINSEIKVNLFRAQRPVGLDLVAVDIQRGRDHGLGSYNEARHRCGLQRARSWHDFLDVISEENVERLSELYKHPDDVDLYVGGFVEDFVEDAPAGPTFLCIIAEQFRRTRMGDRFFYNYRGAGFTPAQLDEIRKATVARLLCDNSDDVKTMQPKAFKLISHDNPLVPCESLPYVNLKAWEESHGEWQGDHETNAYAAWEDAGDQIDHEKY